MGDRNENRKIAYLLLLYLLHRWASWVWGEVMIGHPNGNMQTCHTQFKREDFQRETQAGERYLHQDILLTMSAKGESREKDKQRHKGIREQGVAQEGRKHTGHILSL